MMPAIHARFACHRDTVKIAARVQHIDAQCTGESQAAKGALRASGSQCSTPCTNPEDLAPSICSSSESRLWWALSLLCLGCLGICIGWLRVHGGPLSRIPLR